MGSERHVHHREGACGRLADCGTDNVTELMSLTHADCPQLLDTEDMVRLREPDWKCVYTYIQEFYRCLVQKGLVKTKKS
ncbi:hypothetical protein A6R68_16540 [Neotoma lepida]|uniref:Uncharacterized protein n=1 Tax=Neotoma lepida TaxID=56216 RepID=A0A1A6HEM2_NEOLE|nr:hypothetical protein A6R68_16540 [Neotoma lepida]